jgi:hypothetical protein
VLASRLARQLGSQMNQCIDNAVQRGATTSGETIAGRNNG